MYIPRPLFKNKVLQEEFDRKGYVQVPFLNEEEVEYLKSKFFETLPESGGSRLKDDVDFKTDSAITYDFTFIDKNPDYKQKVFDIITPLFQPKVDQYLDRYKPIIANYIRKQKGGGEVPLHQNWAFVDEKKYTSVSIWVPLVDSNEENGTLQMVDGSHKRFAAVRGPLIPWELEGIKHEIIKNDLVPMNRKAGDAVILDDSIVHYSNINTTDGLRLTIQLIMIPEEAPSIHYHLNKQDKKVHVLETDVDFYTQFHPWLEPKGRRELNVFPLSNTPISYQEFKRKLNEPRFDEDTSFFKKILRSLAG